MFFIKGVNQLSEVHNYCCRFLGAFFFLIAFLQNKIVEVEHLVICLFAIYHIIDDGLNLILFIAFCIKFLFWL